jgi:hypothetical protein
MKNIRIYIVVLLYFVALSNVFPQDSLMIQLKSGEKKIYDLNTILKIKFDNIQSVPIVIPEILEFKTIPNPIKNELKIIINSKENINCELQFFVNNGDLIYSKQIDIVQGENTFYYNFNELPTNKIALNQVIYLQIKYKNKLKLFKLLKSE